MKLSEVANRVIDLARQVRDYYDTELPKRHPKYPLVGIDEESPPPPRQEQELRDLLATISDEMIYQLMLILYLGRGDFSTDGLTEYYENLKGSFGDAADAASEMMFYKATLANELSDGLEELRKHKINVDKLPLTKVKVRKR